MKPPAPGKEPDYRFSLANERTFLAWARTALALMASGVLLHQFASNLGPRWLMHGASIGLTVFAGALSWLAYRQWQQYQLAMRLDQPLPTSSLMALLSAAMVALAVAVGAGLVLG